MTENPIILFHVLMREAAFGAVFDLNILPQFFSGLSLVQIFLTVLTNDVFSNSRLTNPTVLPPVPRS
jgi:hypothetical protein